MGQLPTKTCAWCGRRFNWRKKWERAWDEIEHCSKACRAASKSRKAAALATEAEETILRLTAARGRGKTICPSEAARAIAADDWKQIMPDIQNAARRLARSGKVQITKGGKPTDPDTARGPIRLGVP